MIAFLVVAISAMLTAGLSFYSGFGLGTLLLPVFALFFPADVAVAGTAVVHAANGVFKAAVAGRYADPSLLVRFGIPSMMAAFAGALALGYVSHLGTLMTYSLGPRVAVVTPLKLTLGFLMFAFALFELSPRFRELKFDRKYLILGGILSGFFGGFSGHQGALRSAFLTKVDISTETFVGTTAVISLMVDAVRITTYAAAFYFTGEAGLIQLDQASLVLVAIAASFGGVLIARCFLASITMRTVQTVTGTLLFGIALALGAGLI